jgi:hypothetical protein
MKDKEVYVSFDRGEYRKNKSNILNSQADLLNIAKALQQFKQLRSEDARLRMHLHKMFEQVLKNLEGIEEKLPTPEIPKSVKKELDIGDIKEVKEDFEIEKSITEEKTNSLDEELRNIQDRLNNLNS